MTSHRRAGKERPARTWRNRWSVPDMASPSLGMHDILRDLACYPKRDAMTGLQRLRDGERHGQRPHAVLPRAGRVAVARDRVGERPQAADVEVLPLPDVDDHAPFGAAQHDLAVRG